MGLRELKKAKTRKMISDLATRLFMEKGYDEVTTAEIARLAEVSVPTLFKYFPTKEALVFDEQDEREERLIAAVTDRKKGTSILDALFEHFSNHMAFDSEKRKHVTAFKKLIHSTPDLSVYAKQIWMRYEKSLATVLLQETKHQLEQAEAEAIAHFILDAFHRSKDAENPKASLNALFNIIKNGWTE
ncbi:TetR family transcriptional regulator [Undibacterium sp. CY18W]|uniref:TetR family transcriptional regulator n=1 Tax=Undibacterium hunanense TaxID=2762292 RepID=A0ABR6ZKL6_9BURK|nr:TetR/AcrR family transcriptional regulator [Undibacterium hunanense]MBC3916422.1 TetR family transcriptional regulator [Undibacterium hunanense]